MARSGDIWKDLPLDTEKPHTWAFYYYLKRQGDDVRILHKTKTSLTIWVRKRSDEQTPVR